MELKRRPNGKGSAIYVGSGRNKPWIARITLGWDIEGIEIRHRLGSFSSKLEALICLEEYWKNKEPLYIKRNKFNRIVSFAQNVGTLVPVDNYPQIQNITNKDNYTFKQVFEIFQKAKLPTNEESSKEKSKNLKTSGKFARKYAESLVNAFNYAKNLHDRVYKSLTTADFQTILNLSSKDGYSRSFQTRLLLLFRHLDRYAIQEDIIQRSCAAYANLTILPPKKVPKKALTLQEIIAWKSFVANTPFEELTKDIFIFALYSGCRASEIIFLRIDKIFIDQKYFITGTKTEASRDRQIPIHKEVLKIIKKYYHPKKEFLFTYMNKPIKYGSLADKILKLVKKYPELGQHTLHECRHTFRTELERLGIKQVTINAILGHKNKDIGLDIYTHVTLMDKIAAVNLINYTKSNLLLFASGNN